MRVSLSSKSFIVTAIMSVIVVSSSFLTGCDGAVDSPPPPTIVFDKKNIATTTAGDHTFDVGRWQTGGMTSFEETCFGEYWDDLPPLVEENRIVDPYNFLHRMALGKYLIEHTGGPDCWGPQCWKHWFWAYLAQADWQWRSGRFESPKSIAVVSQKEGEKQQHYPVTIDADSWWGYMNMGFIVGLYCGAAKAGEVPPVNLTIPLLTDDAFFQAIVDDWCAFFQGPHADYVARKVDLTQHPCEVFPLYDKLWDVHTSSLQHGLLGAKHLEKFQPPDELKLGLGWSKMVDLLSGMGWPLLSLDSLMKDGVGYLPTIRLDSIDAKGGSSSVSPTLEYLKVHKKKEYVTCENLFSLYEIPHKNLQPAVKFLKRLSRNNSIRSKLPKILDKLTHGSHLTKGLLLTKLVGLAIIPQTVPESAAWLSFIAVLCAIGTSYGRRR